MKTPQNLQPANNRPLAALCAQYFTCFGVQGIMLPYFNLYLDHLGFTGFQIGALSGVRSAAVVAMPLVWGTLADRYQAKKPIFVAANVISTAFFGLYFLTESFWPMLAISLGYSLFYAPIISFQEPFAMEILGTERNRYGRSRVWGSMSFIVAVLGFGALAQQYSVRVLLPLVFAGSAVQAAISFRMPVGRARKGPGAGLFASLGFFKQKKVIVFLAAAFLMLASHGAYYGFLSIRLARLGYSDAFIGGAWALATLAEVGVMLWGHRLLDAVGPRVVIGASFFVAVARWAILAGATAPWAILGAQLLHAATYGTFHVASIVYIDRVIPREFRTTGQAVNNALTYGLGLTVGFLASGALFERFGAPAAFWASAVAALAGGVLFLAMGRKKPAGQRPAG